MRPSFFATSWYFFKASLKFFRHNLDLLWFPILSLIATLSVFALEIFGLIFEYTHIFSSKEASLNMQMLGFDIAWLIIFYLIISFLVIFFNAALLSTVIARLKGESGLKRNGFKMAAKRWRTILAWSLISATVGAIINALESTHDLIADIIALILQGSWAIGTYFALPILVTQGIGPISALKQSFSLFKGAWRKVVGVNLFLILPFFILWGVLYLFASQFPAQHKDMLAIGIVFFLITLLVMVTFGYALSSIVRSALYLALYEKREIAGFDDEMIQKAFIKRRRFLGKN